MRVREIAHGEEAEDRGASSGMQEKTTWTLQLTTRRGGPNTHRAPNGPLMASQRLAAPSAHMASNPALPKTQSRFAFTRELSLPSNDQQATTAAPSTSGVVSGDKLASGSKFDSQHQQAVFSSRDSR